MSGNVNLAALHVVNADNIAVKGTSMGVPTVAAVNVGALTNASAAASQAAMAAQDVMQRERTASRNNLPSVITVRVIGFGNEPMEGAAPATPSPAQRPVSYNPNGVVQVLDASQLQALTPAERRAMK